jgi:hypothetical protein
VNDEGEREIVSESYRRRVRLMDRLLASFEALHILELLFVVGAVIAAVVLAVQAW